MKIKKVKIQAIFYSKGTDKREKFNIKKQEEEII